MTTKKQIDGLEMYVKSNIGSNPMDYKMKIYIYNKLLQPSEDFEFSEISSISKYIT